MSLRRRALIAATAAAACLGTLPVAAIPADLVPEQVPDRIIVASEPLERGSLLLGEVVTGDAATPKVVDGDPSDWTGQASHVGGTSVYSSGEHIYSDFVLDAWGADEGDADRLALLDEINSIEPRAHRVDALQQAAGDQFGAPAPVGTPDHYGEVDHRAYADITEVRWAADQDWVYLLVRVNQLGEADAARFAVRVIAPSEQGIAYLELDRGSADVVVDAAGLGGVLEARIDRSTFRLFEDGLAVVAGTTTETGFVPANAAYRDAEPVTIYNDRQQALALAAGEHFTTAVDVDALTAGATQTWDLGPGYHERTFTSSPDLSSDAVREQGQTQHYGLYVPTTYDPASDAASPLTFWLHYRGGKGHSGAAWTPRLITQLGEETGTIVVTPRARGTSTWYVSEAHADFFEVFDDVHGLLPIDPQRRYVSGYSMGGYGTWLFTTLYPDLFAAGFTQSGALTQGAWTGVGPDCPDPSGTLCYIQANGGDANAQLPFRALANLRHVPIAIDHGTDDELVPITGLERMAAELTRLGYAHMFTRFHGYEHYTQAIVDEWADGAAYLQRFTAPVNPRHVTYRVVPMLVDAVNTVTVEDYYSGDGFDFTPDGAYWVDDIVVADGAPFGQVDAISHGIVEQPTVAVPLAGATSVATVNPGNPVGQIGPTNQTTTFTRTGLDEIADPTATAPDPGCLLEVTLTDVESVTFDLVRAGFGDCDVVTVAVTAGGATETRTIPGTTTEMTL